MELQLIIKNDLKNSFPERVEFNYPELKATLNDSLEKYKGIVYDESQIREAKADRASLNKLRDAIDAERKAVKAICLKPFEDFEAKTKELIAMIAAPSKEIDVQVKKFEDGKKAEKKAELEAFYSEVGADVIALVPFEKIFEEKWLNASVSIKSVQDVIKNTAARISRELKTIDGYGGNMALQCKDVYLKTLNLSDALNEKTRLEELQARLVAQKAEEARKKEEAVKSEQTVTTAAPMQMHSPSSGEPGYRPPVTQTAEPIYTLEFRILNATRAQLNALSAFLKDHNFTYERV